MMQALGMTLGEWVNYLRKTWPNHVAVREYDALQEELRLLRARWGSVRLTERLQIEDELEEEKEPA